MAVLAIAAADVGACQSRVAAETVVAKPGLLPEFSRWPIPIYTSAVTNTQTWGPKSYAIQTKDPRSKVIAWYLAKLKDRTTPARHPDGLNVQVLVDGAGYVINLEKANNDGTSINVIKNG